MPLRAGARGKEGIVIEHYDRPVTVASLRAAWALRDDQYARLPKPLTDVEVAGIIEARQREVMFLPKEDRKLMWLRAKTWYAPIAANEQ